MSNSLTKAIERLQKNILTVVKHRMVQQGPDVLIAYYNAFLQPATVPDRKAKSGRRYFSRPNEKNKLRTQYGNIQRALQQGGVGNITDVQIKDGAVSLISGIDEDATVNAGPDRITLAYARYHEEGTKNFRARPFLQPGFELFLQKGIPKIMDMIEEDLLELYRGN